MDFSANLYCIALGSFFVIWLLKSYRQKLELNPNRLPLPPGPKGYPLIGNLLDLPSFKPWLEYDKWFKTYGDMVYFEVLGQPFLVLGKYERTYDLFEKRSSNYADRPRMPMVLELMDWTYNMAFLRYGDWWRRHRRVFHDHFHPNVVHKYQSIQLDTTRACIRRLLASPDRFMIHTRHLFASTIMRIVYGITIREEGDPYVELAEEALAGLAEAGSPGAFLVDLIPAMKYIPSWLPGAGFKRKANHWSYINNLVSTKPFKDVKQALETGTAVPSVATSMIEKLPEKGSLTREEEETIATNICAVAYVGGADTTVSTVQSFFMAMALFPEAQKSAQAELDAVLGGRLPEFNDRASLPYVNAVMKECMRWQLVTPLAVAHMSTDEDEYDGYYIPKGTIVIGNAWSILHDPDVFDDPLTFNPERYLKDGKINPEVRDPSVAAFGFGRRACPGRYLSDSSLFAIVAHILAVFDIRPTVDENGKELEIQPEMTSGLLSYPVPFSCSITPRSKMAEKLIKNSELLD